MKKACSIICSVCLLVMSFGSVLTYAAKDSSVSKNPNAIDFENDEIISNYSKNVKLTIGSNTYIVDGTGGVNTADPADSSNHCLKLETSIPTVTEITDKTEDEVKSMIQYSDGATKDISMPLGLDCVQADFYVGTDDTVCMLRLNGDAPNSWTTLVNILTANGGKAARFVDQNGGWLKTVAISTQKWYTMRAVIQKSTKTIKFYLGEKNQPLAYQTQYTSTESTGAFDRFLTGTKLLNFQVSNLASTNEILYLDNLSSTAYQEMHMAVNACSTASQVEQELSEYAALGAFTQGTFESLSYTDGFYDELLNQNFTSDADLQTKYNSLLQDYSTYTTQQKVYYNWNFDNATLNDSVSSGNFCGWYGNGGVPYTLSQNPIESADGVAWNNLSSGTASEILVPTDNVNKDLSNVDYVFYDYDVYRSVNSADIGSCGNLSWNMRMGGGATRFTCFGINQSGALYTWDKSGTDDCIVHNYGQAWAKDLMNCWVSLRNVFNFTEHTMSIYILSDGQYKLFSRIKDDSLITNTNSAWTANHFNAINLQFQSGSKGGVYFDDVKLSSYKKLYKEINNVGNAKSAQLVLKNFESYDLVALPDSYKELTTTQQVNVANELVGKTFASDEEVITAINDNVEISQIKAVAESQTGDIFIYHQESETLLDKDYIKNLSVVINKDGVSAETVYVVAASYTNGELTDVKHVSYNGSLAKYSAINMDAINLEVTGADTMKVFILSDFSTLKPLVHSLESAF